MIIILVCVKIVNETSQAEASRNMNPDKVSGRRLRLFYGLLKLHRDFVSAEVSRVLFGYPSDFCAMHCVRVNCNAAIFYSIYPNSTMVMHPGLPPCRHNNPLPQCNAEAGGFSQTLIVSPAWIVMISPLLSAQMSVEVGLKTMCPLALVRS